MRSYRSTSSRARSAPLERLGETRHRRPRARPLRVLARRRRRGRACPRPGRARRARPTGSGGRGPRACTSPRPDRGDTPSARCRARASAGRRGGRASSLARGPSAGLVGRNAKSSRRRRDALGASQDRRRRCRWRPCAVARVGDPTIPVPARRPGAPRRRGVGALSTARRPSTGGGVARDDPLDLERLGLGRSAASRVVRTERIEDAGQQRAELELVEEHAHPLRVERPCSRSSGSTPTSTSRSSTDISRFLSTRSAPRRGSGAASAAARRGARRSPSSEP